jgi:hypothetical protein
MPRHIHLHIVEMSQAYLKVMAYHSKKMACPWASFDKCESCHQHISEPVLTVV